MKALAAFLREDLDSNPALLLPKHMILDTLSSLSASQDLQLHNKVDKNSRVPQGTSMQI